MTALGLVRYRQEFKLVTELARTYLSRRHHHAATDSVKRIRSNPRTGGDSPTEKERGKEVVLERTDQNHRLDGVVHAKVEAAVNHDASDGWHEAAIETGDSVRRKGLLVHINETVELTGTSGLGVLVVIGKTGTGVVERVDEEEGGGAGSL